MLCAPVDNLLVFSNRQQHGFIYTSRPITVLSEFATLDFVSHLVL